MDEKISFFTFYKVGPCYSYIFSSLIQNVTTINVFVSVMTKDQYSVQTQQTSTLTANFGHVICKLVNKRFLENILHTRMRIEQAALSLKLNLLVSIAVSVAFIIVASAQFRVEAASKGTSYGKVNMFVRYSYGH